MIRAVMVISTQGKPRLLKFYEFQPPEKQQEIVRYVYGALSGRPDNVSNFVDADSIFGPGTRLVYKHMATLYIVFAFDSSENELAMLDLIQVFVQTLDRCFKNVCELDIIFNFNKKTAALLQIARLASVQLRTGMGQCIGKMVLYNKELHTILDEMILGGQVIETNSDQILRNVDDISRIEKSSSTTSLMPKSISARFGR